MKKIFLMVLSVFLVVSSTFFISCKRKADPLLSKISELRLDVYSGQSENYTVKAGYGYKNNQKDYLLTIKLVGNYTDNVTYTVKFNYGEKEYVKDFTFHPVKCSLYAEFYINDFNSKEFSVEICKENSSEQVLLKSELPEQTLTYAEVLRCIKEKQPDIINRYTNENQEFIGNITMRVLVKNEHPYYYVGMSSEQKNLKALLVDGISGEILAIREVL